MSTVRKPTVSPASGTSSVRLYKESPAGGSRAEAGRWLDSELGNALPDLLVVIGLADGELLAEVDRRSPSTKVLALEPDGHAAASFQRQPASSAWRSTGRLKYLAGPEYAGAADAWRLFSQPDGFRLITHPRLIQGPCVLEAARVVKTIVFGVRANAEARRRFAPRYLLNVIRNLPSIARGRDVRALAGRFPRVPAVITAAGPSLDASLGDLRDLQSRALLIATDTTLRPLLSAGIAPHLTVGADPGTANARHFLELPDCPSTWLVAESALDHTASARFAGRTFWFRLSNHHPWPWLNGLAVDAGQIDMWGSVLTAAFRIACLAGCDPIVTIGADLAFTGGRPYCRGTTYEFDWAYHAALGVPLENTWQAQMSRGESLVMPDVNGREVRTTRGFTSFRDWMVAQAGRSGRRVINATGGGILHGPGVVQQTLAEALGRCDPLPAIDLGVEREPDLLPPPALIRSLRLVGDQVSSADNAAAPVADWREFSGDGFNATALSDALHAGANALESDSRTPTPLRVIPWPQMAAPHVAARVIANLAESTSYRDSTVPTGAPPSSDDAVVLLDALGLLDRISAAMNSLETLRDASAGTIRHGGSPLTLYEWPEPLRFAVQLFEGLLAGITTAATATRSSYFSGQDSRGEDARSSADVSLSRARLGLLSMWVQRAVAACGSSHPAVSVLFDRLKGLERALSRAHTSGRDTVLVISAESRGQSTSATISLPVAPGVMARALTGAGPFGDRPWELGCLDSPAIRVFLSIALENSPAVPPAPMLVPRVLTDTDTRRFIVAYATGRGAVCVVPYACHSVIVRQDGSIEPHLEWPHPIVGELPYGETGAVAWDNGMAASVCGRARVMYRRSADDAVAVQEIDVRPTIGAWWQGRLYWNCFPTPMDTWVGVASWSPGETVRLEFPDLTLHALLPGADGLRLEPCVFRPGIGYERRKAPFGSTLRVDGRVDQRPIGPHGQQSCLATGAHGTASLYPESDLIAVELGGGRIRHVTCDYPHRAAWIGGALLVSTVARDLLLFPDLAGAPSHDGLAGPVTFHP